MEKYDDEKVETTVHTRSNDNVASEGNDGELITLSGIDPALAAKVEMLNDVSTLDNHSFMTLLTLLGN